MKLKEEINLEIQKQNKDKVKDFFNEENSIKDYIEEIKILMKYTYIESSTSNETLIKSNKDEDVFNNFNNLEIDDMENKHHRNSRYFSARAINNINNINHNSLSGDKKDNKNDIDNFNNNNGNNPFKRRGSSSNNNPYDRRGSSASIRSQFDCPKEKWVYDPMSDNESSRGSQLFHFSGAKRLNDSDRSADKISDNLSYQNYNKNNNKNKVKDKEYLLNSNKNSYNYFNDDRYSITSIETSPCISK